MKILPLLLMLMFLVSTSLNGQINKKDLQGDWIKFKAEMKDGSRVIDREKTHTAYLEYNFQKNILCINKDKMEMNFCRKFQVKNNDLSISDVGNFTIIYFQNDTLVLEEKKKENNQDDIKRLYFTRGALLCANQEKQYEEEVLIATPYLSPEFQNSFSEHIYNKLKTTIKATQFKGYFVLDRDRKTVKTVITENKNSDQSNLDPLVKIINKSFKYWTYKDYYVDDKHKVYFVGKALEGGDFKNLRFAMFTKEYDSIKKDTRLLVKEINQGIHHYNEALDYFSQRKFEEAIVEFTKSYELDETNIEAIYNRAMLYGKIDKSEEACKDLKYLVELGQVRAQKLFEKKCAKRTQN